MRTLITGSAGFIASHLKLPAGTEYLSLDSADGHDVRTQSTMDLIRKFDPEIVYHLAAVHFIPWCEANPIETERTNVMGTANVLEACHRSLKVFVLASSAAVYGFSPSPIAETAPLIGKSVYAHSKYQAEVVMRSVVEGFPKAAFVAARLFNVVGPGDTWSHVLPVIINHRYEEIFLGNTWPKRDYVHVDDVAEALQFLAKYAPPGFSAWNVGTGIGTSVSELVSRVAATTGVPIKTRTYAGKVRADDGHLVADPSSLSALGWSAQRTLKDAIYDILQLSK